MSNAQRYASGSLVRFRERDWVVLPSVDPDLLMLQPLGGTEAEITGVYLPLKYHTGAISDSAFPWPSAKDISDFRTAGLLFDAARLSFRNASGAFRCLGRLSFRPRAYQMVPLIMALKQQTIRLMIADDVGVGKTVEALLIARELMDRGIIKSFAIVCLPHLCDQWQEELKAKFGIEAVIIRSGTAARLDRMIPGDLSPFQYYPYQIISIDYVKSETKKALFLQHAPDLVIVDEAHSCARPQGSSKGQQQRYAMLRDLANKPNQNLVLLTATPHSGKQDEFQSLLGLLDKEFETTDLTTADEVFRKKVAGHFVQRRRKDIEKWMGEDTQFPLREAQEIAYTLDQRYEDAFAKVLEYARSLTKSEGTTATKAMSYWSALALLRGVISSPAAGEAMLRKKASGKTVEAEEDVDQEMLFGSRVADGDNENDDTAPSDVISRAARTPQDRELIAIADTINNLRGVECDAKIATTLAEVRSLLKSGYNPIVFCRYIATANYVGEQLKTALTPEFKHIAIETITSESPDDERKERIDEMRGAKQRILVATDCLSEGVNLQDGFTALLHYDLPWNPNRLEQREGRIDRFGQANPDVQIRLLFAKNNPVDGVVLNVLLKKARQIRKSTGYTVPFPEDSRTIIDAVMKSVLLNPNAIRRDDQMAIHFDDPDIQRSEVEVTKAYQQAIDSEKATRSIFAQHGIKAQEVEVDLQQADEAIGNVAAVEHFTIDVLRRMGAELRDVKNGYVLIPQNLDGRVKSMLPSSKELRITFKSPAPENYAYIGRNHPLVEHLCNRVMNDAMHNEAEHFAARAAVIRTDAVERKTTLLQCRVRVVINEAKSKQRLVAEEMIIWGWQGSLNERNALSAKAAAELFSNAKPVANMDREEIAEWLDGELRTMQQHEAAYKELSAVISEERAQKLVESHERFRKVIKGEQYNVVKPVLPVDVLGLYVLLPQPKAH